MWRPSSFTSLLYPSITTNPKYLDNEPLLSKSLLNTFLDWLQSTNMCIWLTSMNEDKENEINNNKEYVNHMSRNHISWYLHCQHLHCHLNHLTQTIVYTWFNILVNLLSLNNKNKKFKTWYSIEGGFIHHYVGPCHSPTTSETGHQIKTQTSLTVIEERMQQMDWINYQGGSGTQFNPIIVEEDWFRESTG